MVNSLYVTSDASAVRELHPEDPRFHGRSDHARAIVSEPLGDLPGLWPEVAAGTSMVVQPGEDARSRSRPVRLPCRNAESGVGRSRDRPDEHALRDHTR